MVKSKYGSTPCSGHCAAETIHSNRKRPTTHIIQSLTKTLDVVVSDLLPPVCSPLHRVLLHHNEIQEEER